MKFNFLPITIAAAFVFSFGSSQAQIPANNACANAISIQSAIGQTVGAVQTLGPYDNSNATVDPTDPTTGF